jgi:seryl-tRNA synthetase
MLDIHLLESNDVHATYGMTFRDAYKKDLADRGDKPSKVDDLLKRNDARKKAILEFETLRAEQNKVGTEIAKIKKEKGDASHLLSAMQEVSAKMKSLDEERVIAENDLKTLLDELPNKFHSSVPRGKSEADNQITRTVGSPGTFSFKPKDHADLAEQLGIIDFERATKTTGARFAFMKGLGSRLERALIQYMMDLHINEHGYTEMIPPFIVNSMSMYGTGQFPKFKTDVFHLENSDYYLIPTAETSVTNFYANEILEEKMLPQSFCAYSPCFRSEAGSYGKDTKGIFRVHQFNKVELLHFVHPDVSYELHEKMVNHAETVLSRLELPYRVVNKCTADMTFSSAKCYDLEVWLPGQNSYREISSCSNFEDFQARRASIRFRPDGPKAKPRFVHTLNGSGVAVGRTVIGILENFQQEDGTIKIPGVLSPYMGGLKTIKK